MMADLGGIRSILGEGKTFYKMRALEKLEALPSGHKEQDRQRLRGVRNDIGEAISTNIGKGSEIQKQYEWLKDILSQEVGGFFSYYQELYRATLHIGESLVPEGNPSL
jgi:hypothetical protein